MRLRPLRNESGLSLPELIVVSAILMTLTGVVYALFRYQSQTFNRQSAKAMTQGDLRLWLARMANEFRRANYDPTGANTKSASLNRFTLQTFTSTELTFTSDLDADGVIDTNPVETRGYRLSGGSLQFLQNGGPRTVLTGVTNGTIFTYVDGQGVEFTPDTTQGSRRAIGGVKMTLTAEASTSGVAGVAKPTMTETVTVYFRNLVY